MRASLSPSDSLSTGAGDNSMAVQIDPLASTNLDTGVVAALNNGQVSAGPFADRLNEYVLVTKLADVNVLVSDADEALNEPFSPATMTRIEILLGRLFEVDPAAAASFLRSHKVPTSLQSSIFRLWAEIDSSKSIILLNDIDDPSMKRRLALAIIELSGVGAIDSIVAAAPIFGRDGLEMAALVERAKTDPFNALLEIPDLASREAQEIALVEIGRLAGRLDAVSGVSAAESIRDTWLKNSYLETLFTQWALTDLQQFFTFLENVDPRPELSNFERGVRPEMSRFQRALASAAESDPMDTLTFGQNAGGALGRLAESAALKVLSAEDPIAAINYLNLLSAGDRRDELAISIATGYAQRDFNSALSWATALVPPSPRARNAVLQVLATSDFAQAVRIELENPTTRAGRIVDAPIVPSWFGSRMISDLIDPAAIADQIAAFGKDGMWKDTMLSVALERWAITDPNGVIAWIQMNRAEVPLKAVQAVAAEVVPHSARLEVDQLIRFGDILEPSLRPRWIEDVIGNVAGLDPNVAVAVAERYRSEAFYDSLLTSIVRGVTASQGPEQAARIIGTSPSPSAVMTIARRWAQLEPRRAANWVVTLPDAQARSTGVSTLAGWWAENDRDAAIDWVQNLSDRDLRRQGMAVICRRFMDVDDCE